MIITIIGKGFVGKATMLLENPAIEVWTFDVNPDLCHPRDLDYQTINQKSDLVFIAVPTPMKMDGSCDTSILETVLRQLNHPFVVIRSTVPIGFSASHGCFFMPEFLTEKNWPQDFYQCGLWIFGMPGRSTDDEFRIKATSLIESAHSFDKIKNKELLFCSNEEAEIIKLVRNNFLSTKVAFFNEIYTLCNHLQMDYQRIRQGIVADSRIGPSHTMVGGEYKGYGGTCFPKDTNSLFHIFQKYGLQSHLLEASLYLNEYILNPEKPWLSMYDRTISRYEGRIVLMVNIDRCRCETIARHLETNPCDFVIGIQQTSPQAVPLLIHQRYLEQFYDLSQRIFIPRCDVIHVYIPSGDGHLKKINTLLHMLEFASIGETPLKVEFENPHKDAFLVEWVASSGNKS